MPIILAVDLGKFEVPEESVAALYKMAENAHKLLHEGSRKSGQTEYRALFDWLKSNGVRVTLVDPRPVDLILPSPSADPQVLRRIFVNHD